jgi:hypothetical protein
MIRAAFPGHETNMSKQFKVAVVGATGAVGEVMLSILAERDFPASDVIALASERSAGMTVAFGNGDLVVQDLATFDPAGVDIALFSAGGVFQQGIRAEVRRRRRGGDRQLLGLPLRRRRAAGGVRGQSRKPSATARAASSPTRTARPCR